MTVDLRLLVATRHHRLADDLLEQLLRGTLRVHAVTELVPDPRVALRDGSVNPTYGRHVPAPPVHRHRDAVHYAEVTRWTGDVVVHDHAAHRAARRELAARFATQEATRAAAVEEVVQVLTDRERLRHVRELCDLWLTDADPGASRLARDVLELLDDAS